MRMLLVYFFFLYFYLAFLLKFLELAEHLLKLTLFQLLAKFLYFSFCLGFSFHMYMLFLFQIYFNNKIFNGVMNWEIRIQYILTYKIIVL